MTTYPQLFRLRQQFEGPVVEDVAAEVEQQLASLSLSEKIQPGQSVAITAGSRGIANIHIIIRGISQHLKALGAEPFIVPAMGSHGGATADGQKRVLANYGISEETMGCPLKSDIEPELIAETPDGLPVYVDQNALRADHIVVVNRVKPHTDFEGDIGSGLMKMLAFIFLVVVITY